MSVSVLALRKAADWLIDYSEVFASWMSDDGSEQYAKNKRDSEELLELARKLRDLSGDWESRVKYGDGVNAAAIVADMLLDWKLPGAVWYEPKLGRFRLVGEGYQASKAEVCCGTYLPGAPAGLLAEDFMCVMQGGRP